MAHTVIGIFDKESDARESLQRMQKEGNIPASNIDISTDDGRISSKKEDLDTDRTRSGRPSSPWDSRSMGIDIEDTLNTPGYSQINPEFDRTGTPDFNPAKQGFSNTDAHRDETWDKERELASPNQKRSGKNNEGVFDRIGNFFSNLLGNDDDARRYTNASRNRTIVTVHARSQNDAEIAANIMDNCGALDVDNQLGDGNIQEHDQARSKRRSRIFDRPVAAEYRLNSGNEKNDTDENNFSDRKPLF